VHGQQQHHRRRLAGSSTAKLESPCSRFEACQRPGTSCAWIAHVGNMFRTRFEISPEAAKLKKHVRHLFVRGRVMPKRQKKRKRWLRWLKG